MADLFDTEDGREGLLSFVERREARFVGRAWLFAERKLYVDWTETRPSLP